MSQSKKQITDTDDVSMLMKATLGATVVSLVTSFSTHHITAQAAHTSSTQPHVMTASDVGHLFEREREVLHAHSSLGRTRYATVSGNNG
jgi:hypothetical protein